MRIPHRAGLALALLTATLSVSGMGVPSAAATPATPSPGLLDSVGTDFWTAFPAATGLGNPRQTLFVSATGNGSVTVSGRDGQAVATRSLAAGQVEGIEIPTSLAAAETDGVGERGLHIEATTPISVYGVSYLAGASTGFQAFPVDALGTSYRALSYPGLADTGLGSRLTVVATDDDTTVTVTPKATVRTRAGGAAFSVELDAGQTYQLQDDAAADISGTAVEADRPVVLLAGTGCANVPLGAFACNPLLQQMTPIPAWGTSFVSARLATRTKGDTYRVLAAEDGTVVRVGGVDKASLDAGELYETVLPDGASDASLAGVHIETTKPSFVSQYGNGTTYDGTTGDPLMMSVPPAGQYLTNYVVAAPDVNATPAMVAYINLVSKTADTSGVRVDGAPVPDGQWVPVTGSEYAVAQLQVAAGQHAISSATSGVGVNVYEWGSFDGFGFTGGQGVRDISTPPAPPVVEPLVSRGSGQQSVTLPVPAGGRAALLSDGAESTRVQVPQGTYVLDPATNTVSFVPARGFTGRAAPVTFRVFDAFAQYADATYVATVVAGQTPQTGPKPTARLGMARLTTARLRDATVPLTCRVQHARLRACTVTLTARIGGRSTVIGTGTWRGLRGRVALNAAGRAAAAVPGGKPVTARLSAQTSAGVLRARATGRIVRARFTLAPKVRFAPTAVSVTRADRAWLQRLGHRTGRAVSVTCTGHTDDQGSTAWNRWVSQRRAASVCAALDLPKRVRVVLRGRGEAQPVASNATSAGRSQNRRVTITFRY